MTTYTITDHDEARNRCLLVQAKVERQMRGQTEPPPANHAPLRSIATARAGIALHGSLAAWRRNHPLEQLTLRATAEHILNEGPTEV